MKIHFVNTDFVRKPADLPHDVCYIKYEQENKQHTVTPTTVPTMMEQIKTYQEAILTGMKRLREQANDTNPELCSIIEEFERLYAVENSTFGSLYLLNLDLYTTLVITDDPELQTYISILIEIIENFPTFFA